MKADVAADTKSAVDFLQWLRPTGPWLPTAIVPDGATTTITARSVEDVIGFILKYDGRRNFYFSPNPTRTVMSKKAAKIDIAAIEFLYADLDPAEGETPEAAKARYMAQLGKGKLEASALWDSGGGLQALWRLADRIPLGKPEWVVDGKSKKLKYAPADQAKIDDVEARCAALMVRLGGSAGTQNIDRVLRLPGTVNLPNKAKREKGRVVCLSKLISTNDACYSLEDFPAPATTGAPSGQAKGKLDWDEVEKLAGWLKSVADLPTDFNRKGKMIVAHSGSIQDLSDDLMQAGLLAKPYQSNWSAVTFALASIFKADGSFSNEKIAAALMCPLECNKHIVRLKGAPQRRAVERAIFRSHNPKAAVRAARTLNWRECRADGAPIPSLHNARLAIVALGIECRHDVFHNKMLFGFSGDAVRHEVQALLG
jgi:hypothetical protein